MTRVETGPRPPATRPPSRSYPLVDALLARRSRRFGKGMRLNGGPLAYASGDPPQPLSLDEEAALAFAAAGITGPVLADLPYESGETPGAGGGNIMVHFTGRTVPSADAVHAVSVFVLNDEGSWLLRRPQDFSGDDLQRVIAAVHERRFTDAYLESRWRIADERLTVTREVPFVPPFNKWSVNQPGTTYFVLVADLTLLAINLLLSAFDDEFALGAFDERQWFRAAGVGRFSRGRGGHLHDDPRDGRFLTVGFFETWLCELAAIEQGAMIQSLALMAEALGLGGFPHFASHPYAWFQALGFSMRDLPASRVSGTGRAVRWLLKASRRDLRIPTPVGLERDGQVLLSPFCPPHYASMEEAVLAVVDLKRQAILPGQAPASRWRRPDEVQARIPGPSDRAIAATIAYATYIHDRYGRFPSAPGPFRTVMAYQAHHLDPAFYDRFYVSGQHEVEPGPER